VGVIANLQGQRNIMQCIINVKPLKGLWPLARKKAKLEDFKYHRTLPSPIMFKGKLQWPLNLEPWSVWESWASPKIEVFIFGMKMVKKF
jgi:hypothetical protein